MITKLLFSNEIVISFTDYCITLSGLDDSFSLSSVSLMIAILEGNHSCFKYQINIGDTRINTISHHTHCTANQYWLLWKGLISLTKTHETISPSVLKVILI